MARVRDPRNKAIDEALRAMYRAVEARPVPDRLKSVIDQLDAGESQAPPVAVRRRS